VKDSLRLAKTFLFSPSEAAAACERPDAWKAGLKLWAVLALVQLWSAWFNPLSFLDPNAPAAVAYGAAFWLRVALWQPVMFALTIFFVALALEWMREGALPVKLASTALWAAIPLALAAYYAAQRDASRGLFVGLLAVWLVPGVLLARRIPARRWLLTAVFMTGLSALQLATLAVEYLTVVPLRSRAGFIVLGAVSTLWLLAVAGKALRPLLGLSTPRAVLGFFLGLLVSIVVPALAFALGLMPMEVLKVVIYV
jgi:hypothetical protein